MHNLLCRRSLFTTASLAALVSVPLPSFAAVDCFQDCTSNCNRVTKDFKYCQSSCAEYCLQTDRRDGLSGSVGNDGNDVGFLSAFDIEAKITGKPKLQVYGTDRPPALPLPSGVNDFFSKTVLDGRR